MSRKYTVTVPDDLGNWLDEQPHLSPSGLLQKAIKDQRELESWECTPFEDLPDSCPICDGKVNTWGEKTPESPDKIGWECLICNGSDEWYVGEET